MDLIEKYSDKNFEIIREIANEVWPLTYGAILSKNQLDFEFRKYLKMESD